MCVLLRMVCMCVCACVRARMRTQERNDTKNVSWTDLSQEIPGGLSVLLSTRLAKTWTSKATYSIRRELRESFSFVENEKRSKRECFMVEEFVVRWNRIRRRPTTGQPFEIYWSHLVWLYDISLDTRHGRGREGSTLEEFSLQKSCTSGHVTMART